VCGAEAALLIKTAATGGGTYLDRDVGGLLSALRRLEALRLLGATTEE
jgi:hypothetical protein